MPVRPLCHGAWCFWPGSQGLSRSRGMRFLVKFGSLGEVERLDPAEADHPRRHPVGHHDHVALDRLARRQLVLHLGVELGVVVDVVGVGHRDAGLLLEDRHRGPGLVDRVDVGRPVRDDQPLVGRRDVLREARGGVLLGPLDGEEGELQCREAGTHERGSTHPPNDRTPRDSSGSACHRCSPCCRIGSDRVMRGGMRQGIPCNKCPRTTKSSGHRCWTGGLVPVSIGNHDEEAASGNAR